MWLRVVLQVAATYCTKLNSYLLCSTCFGICTTALQHCAQHCPPKTAYSLCPAVIHHSASEYACHFARETAKWEIARKVAPLAITLAFQLAMQNCCATSCKTMLPVLVGLKARVVIGIVFRTKNQCLCCYLELIEDPVNEEKERRRKAIEKWTEESHEEFANG